MSIIDFHAHILPNADHGSDSIDTSLFQLAEAEAVGVTNIVATPHFYPDHHHIDDFLARRARCARALADRYDGAIQITLGAEVLLCEGLAHLPQLPQLCVDGTDVLLLEMPLVAWARRHIDALSELRELGRFSIVLAHVDRYPPDQVEALLARGFLGQINAGSLCHLMERKRLLRWVQQYDIVALGSDIHGTSNAYGKFQRAYTLLGKEGPQLMAHTAQLLGTARTTSANLIEL